ncbi:MULTISPECIES: M20 family metallopeptidase [unclassified Oceanobacillus]|uniref:M20 family metallopeptidase n=1 Tax=unclassified Oceanobacillus TaxID=2630292 RepID=UPI00300DE970
MPVDFITIAKCEEILKSLVQTNTTNPPGNEMELVRLILNLFNGYPIDYEVLEHGNNRGSLVITIEGEKKNQSIAFIGHLDTVPVTDEQDWKYPPFEAKVVEDYLHGRGSVDMKGGVTSMIVTALYLVRNSITPPQTVKFCFTADEESDGIGVVATREAGLLNDTKRLIIPEPTNEKIGLGEKGALWLRIRVNGKATHGSRPELGSNAVEHLVDFISAFKNSVHLLKDNRILGDSTVQVTQIAGGVKTNIIPDRCEATLDIRTIPGNDHKKIINTAISIAENMSKKLPGTNVKIQIENNRPPIMMEEDAAIVKEMKGVYEELNIPVETKGMQFYTDASQVVPQLNIPFVIIGPGEEEMAHQKNERVAISSVKKMGLVYLNYILKEL